MDIGKANIVTSTAGRDKGEAFFVLATEMCIRDRANVYDIIIRPIITERSMAATSDKKADRRAYVNFIRFKSIPYVYEMKKFYLQAIADLAECKPNTCLLYTSRCV